jgi:3-oxoacyl-[acyl-carrier-protein] synthase-3
MNGAGGLSAPGECGGLEANGLTAAASVPICLHEALAEGRIEDGDLVMLVAFGTGFSWGPTLLRW